MAKLKVVVDYSKLSADLQELFNETYPYGVAGQTVRFPNAKGETVTAVMLETEDKVYLVKLSTSKQNSLTDEELDDMIGKSLSKNDDDIEVESSDDEEEESKDVPEVDEDDE
ncbi:MAG: DNA primase [Bacteroidia bacterium]